MTKRTTEERWLPIPGYEGFYEVSDLGRVRSVDRTFVTARGQRRTYKGKLLKPYLANNGYLTVGLKRQCSVKRRTIHSLVVEAFIGPRPDGMEVLHRDGNKTNPVLTNLHYGTKSENAYDTVRHGAHVRANRTHCPRGHELVKPNLVVSHMKRGQRECRACGQAATWLRNHPESGMTLQLVSDDRYARIIN